jgi:arsenite methyltransferase
VSGALAERVFADKLTKVGFTGVEVLDRQPFGLADAALYPLFTPELIELMRDLLAPAQHAEVAVAVTVSASKP